MNAPVARPVLVRPAVPQARPGAAAVARAVAPGATPTTCIGCKQVKPVGLVKFHKHTGMLILMRHQRITKPLYRDCLRLVYSRYQKHTAMFGWWGIISLVATPITLILNASRKGQIARIGAPGR